MFPPTKRSDRCRARTSAGRDAGAGCWCGRPPRLRWRSSSRQESRSALGASTCCRQRRCPCSIRWCPLRSRRSGVLVGLGVGDRRADDRRVFAAACLAAAMTMLVVSAGFAVVALAAMSSIARPFWILILTGGICAATSLTLPAGNPLEPRTAADPRHRARRPASDRGGWARAGVAPRGFFRRSGRPRGAGVRRHPGAGRRRMAALDAGLFRNGRTRLCRVGTPARRRRRGRPFPVRAVRRTGRRRVLAVCGTAPARHDQPGCAVRAAPPPGARAAGGRGSCGSLARVARTWGGLRRAARRWAAGRRHSWRGVSPV